MAAPVRVVDDRLGAADGDEEAERPFATLVAAFQLIESFVEDLSDPFGGAWSVASAREEVDELLKSLPRD